jgi:O-antigen/teichoic acid export membrane protein/tRNA A-37 threonylcarbamoyl transferase component Bud32
MRTPGGRVGVRGWRWYELSGAHILGFADQAIVSAASFLATVMIGRSTLPSELGLYAMGLSLLTSILSIEEALITTPYTTQRKPHSATEAMQAGASLAQTGILSLAISTLLVVAAAAVPLRPGTASELGPLLLVLAVVAPLLLLREFARRFAFAHLRVAEALAQDSLVAAIQVAGLFLLGHTKQMSAVTASAALGTACAITGIMWLLHAWHRFALRVQEVRAVARRNWSLGKWLFATQLVGSLQGLLVYWLLAWLNGTKAAGIYAASMSIALFANPIILGAANVLTPKCAAAWREGGRIQLRRECIAEALRLAAIIVLFCLVVLPFGASLMQILYPAKEYAQQGHTVAVLAIGMLAMAVGIPATTGLTCMERPRVIFGSAVWATFATAGLILWMGATWGLIGTAYAVLIGNAVRSAVRWTAFLTLAGRSEARADLDRAPVRAVIEKLCHGMGPGNLDIQPVAAGLEANVYTVHCHDGVHANWPTAGTVAVKLYRCQASADTESARRELSSLVQLRAALDGAIHDGWTISVPVPLLLCEAPLALVTAKVSGKQLSQLLGERTLPRDLVDSLPRVIVAAMSRLWEHGQLHGDLTFDNILCDVDARTLAFVDPGLRAICPLCDSPLDTWHPASHDLAHMLYDVGVALLSRIADPVTFRSQRRFADELAREVIRTVDGAKAKRRHLNELAACARMHLITPRQHRHQWQGVYQLVQSRVGLWRLRKLVRTIGRDLDQVELAAAFNSEHGGDAGSVDQRVRCGS